MTLIEDARRLLMIGYDEPIGGGVPHPDYLICLGPVPYHAEDCPWGRREQIVQALEAAQVVGGGPCPTYYDVELTGTVNPDGRPAQGTVLKCAHCKQKLHEHAEDCPWHALVAALKGDEA